MEEIFSQKILQSVGKTSEKYVIIVLFFKGVLNLSNKISL